MDADRRVRGFHVCSAERLRTFPGSSRFIQVDSYDDACLRATGGLPDIRKRAELCPAEGLDCGGRLCLRRLEPGVGSRVCIWSPRERRHAGPVICFFHRFAALERNLRQRQTPGALNRGNGVA